MARTAQPLFEATFVVVDLETTGGSPRSNRITEIGAVRCRGGEVTGEFQTLVDPGTAVPPRVAALTGITSAALAGRPPIDAVLPAFLEFCRGATLIAHNARFDLGFLNTGLSALEYQTLAPAICTAALARRLYGGEVPNVRLATLARFLRTATTPTHRALPDARATLEVFYALLERAGRFGVATVEDLVAFARVRDAPVFEAGRRLAADVPHAPGVYSFRSAAGEVLYVGKATDLRARVLQYFGTDPRRRIADLVRETARIEHTVCPTPLEAGVLELRLLESHRPRYNRRSTRPAAAVWLKLTAERWPRLAIVRRPRDDGGVYLGPLRSRTVATQVQDALHDALGLRRCTDRFGPATRFPACVLAEMGRCPAPCTGAADPQAYGRTAAAAAAVLRGDPGPVVEVLARRIVQRTTTGRFEDAAVARDRVTAVLDALARARRGHGLTRAGVLVVSRPARDRVGRPASDRTPRRDLLRVDAGRLVASVRCTVAEVPATVDRLLCEAADGGGGHDRPSPAETELLARWVERPDARLHHGAPGWSWPVEGGRSLAGAGAALRTALAAATSSSRSPAARG